jgi:uncharacterized protein
MWGAVEGIWGAAAAGNLGEVQRLVGQDPRLLNAKDPSGCTPLMRAAYEDHVEVVRWLVDQGALVNESSVNGSTALGLASVRGHTPVVRLLLDGGADPTFVDAHGLSPLIGACHEGHLETLRCLLEHPSAAAIIDHRGGRGRTALFVASMKGHRDLVRALLEKGADPTIPNGEGRTPLAMAKRLDRRACVKTLKVRSSLRPPPTPDHLTGLSD